MIQVYLEAGIKRTFAVVPDWPGWCRSGREENAALQALVDYGPRYARVLKHTDFKFQPPATIANLTVVERLPGSATTDFGAPAQPLANDTQPLDADKLQRMQTILDACWRAFDQAAQAAQGKQLRKGPRGGGRDLLKMTAHLRESENAYFSALGGKMASDEMDDVRRQIILETLAKAARGEIPALGPRGGKRWTPRYFVRRAAWHVLDHAWEIEDRIE